MKKRLGVLLMLCALMLAALPAAAADYPNKPITAYIPLSAGGTSDVFVRTIAPYMEKFLGKPLVLVNKPGSGGAVGCMAGSGLLALRFAMLCAIRSTSPSGNGGRHLISLTLSKVGRISAAVSPRRRMVPARLASAWLRSPSGISGGASVG